MLVIAAAFVRASIPGGLALALGGVFSLQSIGLHNAGHFYDTAPLFPELLRAIFSTVLIFLAYLGWNADRHLDAIDPNESPTK